ncbi:hypothetical protein [Ammoniphilus sp. CFH 90114]|nr:hypothetical protein [Ammoniphilus sp. CFH 90114]
MAVGVLLALDKAKTIDEAESMMREIRPQVKLSPEFKQDLKTLFPFA